MSKRIPGQIFFVFLFFLVGHLSAQQPVTRPTPSKNSAKEPLILVDSFQTSLQSLILDPGKIESINVLKDTPAVSRYGEAGKNGVVIIHPKANVILLRLVELLNKFQVPDSLRKFRVCINEVIISRPDLILIDESEVEGVSNFVSTDWSDLSRPKDERFLNIISKRSGNTRK